MLSILLVLGVSPRPRPSGGPACCSPRISWSRSTRAPSSHPGPSTSRCCSPCSTASRSFPSSVIGGPDRLARRRRAMGRGGRPRAGRSDLGPDQDLALRRAVNYWALVLMPLLPAAMRVAADPRYVRRLFYEDLFGMGSLTVVLGLAQLSTSARLVVLEMNTIQTARAALLVPILGLARAARRMASRARRHGRLIPAAILVALASGARGPVLALAGLGVLAAGRYLVRPASVNWRLIAAIVVASLAVVSVAAATLHLLNRALRARGGDHGRRPVWLGRYRRWKIARGALRFGCVAPGRATGPRFRDVGIRDPERTPARPHAGTGLPAQCRAPVRRGYRARRGRAVRGARAHTAHSTRRRKPRRPCS